MKNWNRKQNTIYDYDKEKTVERFGFIEERGGNLGANNQGEGYISSNVHRVELTEHILSSSKTRAKDGKVFTWNVVKSEVAFPKGDEAKAEKFAQELKELINKFV